MNVLMEIPLSFCKLTKVCESFIFVCLSLSTLHCLLSHANVAMEACLNTGRLVECLNSSASWFSGQIFSKGAKSNGWNWGKIKRVKFILSNPKITKLLGNEVALVISILDPESSLLSENIRYNWESSKKIYSLSRDYVYNVHRKFDKFYEKNKLKFALI